MMDVRVSIRTSRQEGTCNGCTNHTTEHGSRDHKVYVIELRGVYVRVCEECRHELLRQLRNANG